MKGVFWVALAVILFPGFGFAQPVIQDIAKVEITQITSSAGAATNVLRTGEGLDLNVAITNFSDSDITNDLVIQVFSPSGELLYDSSTISTGGPGPSGDGGIPAGETVTIPVKIPDENLLNGTNNVVAMLTTQLGEELFSKNNSDSKYLTVVQRKVDDTVDVPETNFLFVVLTAFFALAVIGFRF